MNRAFVNIDLDRTKIIDGKYWPVLMLFVGMIMVLFQSVGFDLAYIPGDFGDGRFNNYLLEHGYRWLVKSEPVYWDAPFMYPENSVIAYSDNHFGSLPFYVALRFLFDRETSYQLWYLILIVLNYVGCYYALKKLKLSAYASTMGAFIYAFSAILMLQSSHIQLLPRFVAPLATVHFYLWMQNKSNKNLYWALFLLVYQFYCSVYLGYFLMYVLGALFFAYVLIERRLDIFKTLFENRRSVMQTVSVFITVLILMGILLYPYYIQSIDAIAYPSKDALLSMIPRVWSFFYGAEDLILFGDINAYVKPFIPEMVPGDEHHLYIGIVPYVLLIASFVLYRKQSHMKFFLLAIALFLACTVSINNHSIYGVVVDYIPGARAIRAFSRYIVILIFLWSVIAALFIDSFFTNMHFGKIVLLFMIPVFLVIENIHYANTNVCSKKECVARYSKVVDLYNKKKDSVKNKEAFSYQFDCTEDFSLNPEYIEMIKKYPQLIENIDKRFRQKTMVEGHLDAMMASQIVNMPCVNAYTARFPKEYLPYFFYATNQNLELWLTSERAKKESGRTISSQSILILE